MNFKWYRTTDATVEPVTPIDLEEKLVYSSGWNATTLGIDIEAARNMVEKITDRALITQTWTGRGDYFIDVIYLPKGQIQSVTTVKYVPNGSTTFTTLTVDVDYIVELNGDRARIYPVSSWPSDLNEDRKGSIEVVFICGYGNAASDLPGWSKSATMMYAGDLNTNGALKAEMAMDRLMVANKLFFDYHLND
jgi:uncharacterized phiE125 gp8 family phage protein